MANMTQVITLYSGAIPNRNTMDLLAFDQAASDWADWQEALPIELNTWVTQANDLRAEINDWRVDGSGYVAAAEAAQAASETAQALAEDAQTASEVARDASEAYRDAAATAGAMAGAMATGAPLYPTGSPYAFGDIAVGSDGHTYRSLVGGNASDPALDVSGNWLRLTARANLAKAYFVGGF